MKSDKIKIAYVIWSLERGGTESFVLNVLKNLDRGVFEPMVISHLGYNNKNEDAFVKAGVEIIKVKDLRFRDPFKYIYSLQRIFREKGIDVVHTNYYMSNAFAMIAAKRADVALRIAHSHNTKFDNGEIGKKIINSLLKYLTNSFASCFLACSAASGRAMFYKRNKFTVVNNGIDLGKFAYNAADRRSMRGELSMGADDYVWLNVGRLEHEKNHDFLLEIFNKYSQQNSRARLLLVGDGSRKDILREKIAELGLQEKVVMTGSRDDLAKIYSAADVLVMPSKYEGLPVTLIEAQASGLPCVLSDAIDPDVNYGDVHFVSLDASVQDWLDCIADAPRRRQDAPKQLADDYDIGNTARKLETIYGECRR